MRRTWVYEALTWVVAVRVAFIISDDPGEKSGFTVLSDKVVFYAVPPKYACVDVEGARAVSAI